MDLTAKKRSAAHRKKKNGEKKGEKTSVDVECFLKIG